MDGDDGYSTDVGYIPREGTLFVDTCGIQFVGPYDNRLPEVKKNIIKRAKGCLSVFKERDNVVTTNGVLDEIDVIIDIYKRWKSGLREFDFYSRKRDGREQKDVTRILKQQCKSGISVYRKLHKYLDEASRDLDMGSELEQREIRSFIHRYDKSIRLSPVDVELVSGAIYSGDSTGVLSADASLFRTYRRAVEHFRLEDCFVANAIDDVVEWL